MIKCCNRGIMPFCLRLRMGMRGRRGFTGAKCEGVCGCWWSNVSHHRIWFRWWQKGQWLGLTEGCRWNVAFRWIANWINSPNAARWRRFLVDALFNGISGWPCILIYYSAGIKYHLIRAKLGAYAARSYDASSPFKPWPEWRLYENGGSWWD